MEDDLAWNGRIEATFRIAERDFLDAVTIFPFPGIEEDIVDIFEDLAELLGDQLRDRVEDIRTAVRMLEAGPQRRRRWFRSAD